MVSSEPNEASCGDTALAHDTITKAIDKALVELSERQRVSVGMSINLGVEDPSEVAPLMFAKGRIGEQAEALSKAAFEAEAYR